MGTKRVDVRLDDSDFDEVNHFRKEAGIATPSQAIRTLIKLGLANASQLEKVWQRAAWSEGRRQGHAELLEAVQRARQAT